MKVFSNDVQNVTAQKMEQVLVTQPTASALVKKATVGQNARTMATHVVKRDSIMMMP